MTPARSGRLRLAPRLAALAAAIYGFIWITRFPRQWDDDELPPTSQRGDNPSETTPFPVDFDQIVVSIKTTATDAYTELPPLLVLTRQMYYDSLLLMSDATIDIGAFHVEDVLDRYDPELVANTPELDRYRRQSSYIQASMDISSLKEEDAQSERAAQAGLDKYKILRLLERAWEVRPERQWYVFADTSTYIMRENLQIWLGQFDSTKPYFFANPPISDLPDPTGIGGRTFIVSAQTMRQLFVEREKVFSNWDQRIADFRTAHDVLVAALSTEVSLSVNRTWPAISGFHPRTVPYGIGLWCELVIAMDNVPSEAKSDIWRLERDRDEVHHTREPMTYADLWSRFIQPEDLSVARDDWDNLSSSPENAHWNILFEQLGERSHTQEHILPQRRRRRAEEPRSSSREDTWEACQEACNNNNLCAQWSYSTVPTSNYNQNGDSRCHLSRNMRLGKPAEPKTLMVNGQKFEVRWKSGWRKDRFEKWAQHQRCKGQQDKI